MDLVWATLSTAQSGGASGHTFLLFLLVLGAAAYRWSITASLLAALAVVVITSSEAVAATRGYLEWPFELDTRRTAGHAAAVSAASSKVAVIGRVMRTVQSPSLMASARRSC